MLREYYSLVDIKASRRPNFPNVATLKSKVFKKTSHIISVTQI